MPEIEGVEPSDLLVRLIRSSPRSIANEEREAVLGIYKLYVEMADRVSQRRQSANSFYLSVNSLFLGAFAFFGGGLLGNVQVAILGVAGIALCAMWRQSISSYKDLNSGKFEVINAIEEELPIAPYGTEWDVLERGSNSKRFRPFHKVEVQVPWMFAILYITMMLVDMEWQWLWEIGIIGARPFLCE